MDDSRSDGHSDSSPEIGDGVSSFTELQILTDEWRRHNFPKYQEGMNASGAIENMLGMVEEMGEMAHAFLKLMQGIRSNEDLLGKERDAVGDFVIYLCGYCSRRGLSLHGCISEAWDEVKDRDWIKYPTTGRPADTTLDATQRAARYPNG